jgi:hypothetical protein
MNSSRLVLSHKIHSLEVHCSDIEGTEQPQDYCAGTVGDGNMMTLGNTRSHD